MIHRLVKHGDDERAESIWLTIYADMITNLMLVFLALYGLSVMGTEAMDKAIDSMKKLNTVADTPDFEKVVPALQQTVGDARNITITQEVGAIRVQFGEAALFSSGKAKLKEDARAPLLKLGAIFKIVPNTVVVEGHTDNVPLGSASAYRDNYELSLARAMAVADILIKEAGIPAAQIAAAAYGEDRPRAANSDPAGRRLNRRVEIAIFRDFPYPEKPVSPEVGL